MIESGNFRVSKRHRILKTQTRSPRKWATPWGAGLRGQICHLRNPMRLRHPVPQTTTTRSGSLNTDILFGKCPVQNRHELWRQGRVCWEVTPYRRNIKPTLNSHFREGSRSRHERTCSLAKNMGSKTAEEHLGSALTQYAQWTVRFISVQGPMG